jgi:hypothetical protein
MAPETLAPFRLVLRHRMAWSDALTNHRKRLRHTVAPEIQAGPERGSIRMEERRGTPDTRLVQESSYSGVSFRVR